MPTVESLQQAVLRLQPAARAKLLHVLAKSLRGLPRKTAKGDAAILKAHAADLNSEAEQVLEFQKLP